MVCHATTPFSPDDIVEVAGTITNLNDNTITVCTLHLVSVYQAFITTQSYFLTFHPQINAYKCHVSSKSSTSIPRARTWLKAVGTIKTTTQIRNDMAIFIVQATQYVSGSRSSVKSAEFEILVHHHVTKKNLFERTKKARLGSKISLVGELDVHENKLYVELHNFDFVSTNDNQPNISYSTPISSTAASTAASEQRNRLYQSLSEITQPTKRHKVAPTPENSNQSETDSRSEECATTVNQNQTSRKQNQPRKRELRSSSTKKKIPDLAATNLNLPSYED